MKTELKVAIISGLFALISLVFSIRAQYKVGSIKAEYSQLLEESKFSFEERRNGYREFFEGISRYREAKELELQAAEKKKNGERKKAEELKSKSEKLYNDYLRLWDSARFKIGIFSDKDVVHSIAEYFRWPEFKKKKCYNTKKFLSDVAIYKAMRSEMESKGIVQDSDLILVLFDCILEE